MTKLMIILIKKPVIVKQHNNFMEEVTDNESSELYIYLKTYIPLVGDCLINAYNVTSSQFPKILVLVG